MKNSRLRVLSRSLVFAVLALAVSAAEIPAKAQLKVDITRGQVEPLPIALPDFQGADSRSAGLGRQVTEVITADLARSGLFRPIEKKAFIQSPADIGIQPRFGDWRLINAQALVNGRAVVSPDGRLTVEFRLWDVFAQQQMIGTRYRTAPDNWRVVAHRIADKIYQRITGESGYFDTRVVYVAESGPAERRVKRLAIMDQDGANHRYLTGGEHLVLTPRFSPTEQEITFLSFVNNRPRVYLYHIDTGQQEILGDFPGMTFAPRFSPDGTKVVMSMARNGNSEIYAMDLRTRQVRRLTNHPAIDTSPSVSPDGKRVVFNSDRSGQQQIYVLDMDQGNARRMSFGEGRYATPVWSPRGDLIAFTKISRGQFSIGVMRPDGTGERILVTDFLVEGPTWAPNGRVLMYFRQPRARPGQKKPGPKLHSIDLTGYNEREIATPLDASDPAWSPLKR